jgi:hypothetical protein
MPTAEEYEKMSASEKKKEDWMNSKWRPMMGWMYMLVCTCDFVFFPILWSLLQATTKGAVNVQWQPITLQGAGLFHIAMGAVLGIAAYGRTQEKLGGANNGGIQPPSGGTGYTPPAPITGSGFGSPSPTPVVAPAAPAPSSGFGGGFGSPTTTTVTQTFSSAPQVMTSSSGKPMPVQPVQPEI